MYKATLIAPDGGCVTDFKRDTKEQVIYELENIGSRWIFYPFGFVTTDKTIVDTPYGFEFLKGKRIKTAQRFFMNNREAIEERFF